MTAFIDEMRQNFISTQNANTIPQSLMLRQTQMMDRQIEVLEKNQQQIGEIINNIMNKGGTGGESAANVKQNVFNENRRMMLEMLNPVTVQLNEMKLLYENTKSCSNEVGVKIDELKKIIALQQNTITGGRIGPNPFIEGGAHPAQMEQFLDPKVIQRGMKEIREQMREMQKEAHLIETEMETKFTSFMLKNEVKKKMLPESLTSEMEAQIAENVKKLQDGLKDSKPSYNRTRELIIERLGGPFDYNQFQEDIRQIKVQKEQLKREFRRNALRMPDMTSEDFGGKKAYYDYSTRPIMERVPQN